MQIKKNEINKIFTIFLFAHLVIWTLVPSISNINLPLDTIEALAWGNELQMGYEKHPPLSAWFLEFFYKIFGNQDWAYYLLSQLFVLLSFIIIFKFSEFFFKNKIYCLISVLLLEGIYFYNFTTPEFNVNVSQLPFWALTVYYCWRGIEKNDNISWLLFGMFAALGFLSKYLFIYLLLAIDIFFIYLIVVKKFNFKCLISFISFFLVLTPHLIWLVDNNYTTIHYALFRSIDNPLSGFENAKFLNHLFYPFIFFVKQILLLVPFFVIVFFIVKNFKININYKDKKFLFLSSITIVPIFLIFLTSLITGAKIRTMGMSPFYLFMGVFFIYLFQEKIKSVNFKKFFSVFLIIFFISPISYYLISIKQTNERTDYPGKEISKIIQEKWNNNFSNEIKIVVGSGWIDGWYAQNLSYNLKSRPLWKSKAYINPNIGTIWIKNLNVIKDCKGVFYQIESLNDICMIGKK